MSSLTSTPGADAIRKNPGTGKLQHANTGGLVRRILVTLALVLSVAGCGAGGGSKSSGTTTTPTGTSSTAAATQRLLSEKALTEALLGLQDLPPGYSQDPPSVAGAPKTFCDYVPPFQEETRVKREFTKGGGLSAEFLSVGLRQYADADQAGASFKALTNALASCTHESYRGTKLTYAPMSAPKLGTGSIGIKITSDGGPDLLQFFAVVGPVLVNTGGGGLMNANADEVVNLLKAQVNKYEASAES